LVKPKTSAILIAVPSDKQLQEVWSLESASSTSQNQKIELKFTKEIWILQIKFKEEYFFYYKIGI